MSHSRTFFAGAFSRRRGQRNAIGVFIPEVFPHYIDRLGFECVLAESERGRLIVYYRAIPDDKFMVYDIWFRNLAATRAEMERRLALLESGAPPNQLPACQPSWAEKFCPFSPGCGCAQG